MVIVSIISITNKQLADILKSLNEKTELIWCLQLYVSLYVGGYNSYGGGYGGGYGISDLLHITDLPVLIDF